MIRYTLTCDSDHRFDSWFASSDACDTLARAGHLACPQCGSSVVSKALMAPTVRTERAVPSPSPSAPEAPAGRPADRAAALRRLKAEIEARSDYVGLSFATEARRMHTGEAPERMIHGEASPEDARALIEEGVPVAPLPFIPTRRTN